MNISSNLFSSAGVPLTQGSWRVARPAARADARAGGFARIRRLGCPRSRIFHFVTTA